MASKSLLLHLGHTKEGCLSMRVWLLHRSTSPILCTYATREPRSEKRCGLLVHACSAHCARKADPAARG